MAKKGRVTPRMGHRTAGYLPTIEPYFWPSLVLPPSPVATASKNQCLDIQLLFVIRP